MANWESRDLIGWFLATRIASVALRNLKRPIRSDLGRWIWREGFRCSNVFILGFGDEICGFDFVFVFVFAQFSCVSQCFFLWVCLGEG